MQFGTSCFEKMDAVGIASVAEVVETYHFG